MTAWSDVKPMGHEQFTNRPLEIDHWTSKARKENYGHLTENKNWWAHGISLIASGSRHKIEKQWWGKIYFLFTID